MKTNVKKVIVILLVSGIVLLSACNFSKDSGKSPAINNSSSSNQASTDKPKLEEKQEPVKLSILKAKGQLWDDNNPALKMIQEKTNTILEVELAEDLTTQVNLYVASGEIPDILTLSNLDFINYISTGYFLELTDLVNNYGSNLKQYTSKRAWELVTIDGKLYCVPYENFNKKHITAIRKDWLDNLGIEFKEFYTLDEFANIMKAFTIDDPDKDGKKNTYGYSGRNGVGSWQPTFMSIFGAFGGIPDQYYNVNGIVEPFNVSNGFRNALVYINSLWSEGVIDPEVFILNVDQSVQKLIHGAAGTFVGWWSGPRSLYLNGLMDVDPNADWDSIFITSNDGKTFGMKDNGLITQSTMISKHCKNPGVAMNLLNYLGSDEGFALAVDGMEGVHYEVDTQGYRTRKKDVNNDTVSPLSAMVSRLDISTFQNSKPVDKENPMEYNSSRFIRIQWEDRLNVYTNLFYGIPATDVELEYTAELSSYVSQAVIGFITGETPINDSTWNNYLSTWSKKGGQKILDSYVKEYNSLNGTSLKSMSVGQ